MASHILTAPRLVAGTGLICLTAALAVGPSAPARADGPYSVSTFAELTTVLANAWTDTGPVVVEITADLTATGTDQAYYNSPLPLTIHGNGHTLTYATNDEALRFLGSDHPVTITDLTLQGAVSTLSTAPGAMIVGNAVTFDHVTLLSHEGRSTAIQVAAFGGPVVVTDSTFTDAVSTGPWAGALNIVGDTATITGSTFTGNESTGPGAVQAGSTPLTVTDSTFTDNVGGFSGGAIDSYADVTIVDSTFTHNHADVWGGAVSTGYLLTVTRSTFTANSSVQHGGAVNTGGGGTITDSTFAGNSVDTAGGALSAEDALVVTRSTFSSNTSAADGGALSLTSAADTQVTSSTFVGNEAVGSGGAILAVNVPVEIQGSTFDGNSATTAGHVYASNATIYSSASAFTSASPEGGCAGSGTLISQGYNFDADGTCTTGWNGTGDFGSGVNPQLGALADNGGFTQTMLPALTSPLLNVIPDAFSAPAMRYDQRGVDRPLAATTQGGGRDVGAVERLSDQSLVIPTSAGDAHVTVSNAIGFVPASATAGGAATAGGTPPVGVVFPCGVFGFSVYTIGTTPFTITIDLPVPVEKAWKTRAGAWIEIPGLAVLNNGTRLVYTAADDGVLDEDGTASGTFVDPLAPGTAATFTG